MSKHHNYTQYANKNNETVQPEMTVTADVPEVVSTVAPVDPVVEPVTCEKCGLTYDPSETHECTTQPTDQPNCGSIAKGVVINCAKLNVRAEPSVSAAVITTLPVNSEMNIDVDESTNEWYKVYAAAVKGYCMKQYVKISQ